MATGISLMSAQEINERRTRTITKHLYRPSRVVNTQICDKTRVGVVVIEEFEGKNRASRGMKAYFFKPTQLNRYFHSADIKSAHEAMGALKTALDQIAEEKRQKAAPHDLKVGDIMASISAYTSKSVRFYKIIALPTPKSVTMVQLDSKFTKGDWMMGEQMPILDKDPVGKPDIYKVSMASGEARINMGSRTTNCAKWSGNPVDTYCD